MERFARMEFINGTILTYKIETGHLDEIELEKYYRIGSWSKPYPNTFEDSVVFGELEALVQSKGYTRGMLYELGEPKTFEIFEK